VERKRHIGNDVVILVYKEGDTPFDPLRMASQFNHVFIVVQPEGKRRGNTTYRVAIANKPGVEPYGPFLGSGVVFERNNEFREWILTKSTAFLFISNFVFHFLIISFSF
jgi:hypothetical protein